MTIQSSANFAVLSALPLVFLSEPLANYARECDGVKKSRFELLWVVPVNTLSSIAAIPLACVAATINIIAASIFAFISLFASNKRNDQTTVIQISDEMYYWNNNVDGWMVAAELNAEYAGHGLITILPIFARIFYPALSLRLNRHL